MTKNMIVDGTITLQNGETIQHGQGGRYYSGSDVYPVTIVGWSKSGKTIFYRSAKAIPTKDCDYYGEQSYLYVDLPEAPIKAATWRSSKRYRNYKNGGAYVPKGSSFGSIGTNGYLKSLDPSF